jgi:hypothetical protein
MMKWIVLVIALVLGFLLAEVGSRLVLSPADYLSAKTVPDNILGIRIAPNSSGFDEWGFRNKRVPSAADIVALGDSHTYGNAATMNDAWPSVVARVTGHEVYNLGLGGYGPNQYHHLLNTKGRTLHPKQVVCGLYMGDDFENAFLVTYGLEYWSSLRSGDWKNVSADIWGLSDPPVWGAAIRNWFSENSMVYRLVVHGPLLGMLKASAQFGQVTTENDPNATTLVVEDEDIREVFRPLSMAQRLDQDSAPVREGMRITFHLLKEMNEICRQEGCHFLVVIIPTKETVFADHFARIPRVHLRDAVDRVVASEQSAKKALTEFLDVAGIEHLDVLPALKRSVRKHLYALSTRDMHPGRNGYEVIGDVVAEYLQGQPGFQ